MGCISDESRSLRQGVLKTKYEFWGSRVARKRSGEISSRSEPSQQVARCLQRHHEVNLPVLFMRALFLFTDSRGRLSLQLFAFSAKSVGSWLTKGQTKIVHEVNLPEYLRGASNFLFYLREAELNCLNYC